MERFVPLGSVSSGTLRPADLLNAFAAELEALTGEYAGLVHEARSIDPNSEEAGFVLDDLFAALQAFAPPFCFFGAHPNDGADFGFWIDEQALEDAEDAGELVRSTDPPSESVPVSEEVNAWLHIDRSAGTVTLYLRSAGAWRAVWSV